MQSDYHNICRLTTDRTGRSEEMYKDLCNLVFSKLYDHFRRPDSLIINLAGIGRWHIRKKRMETILDLYPADYGANPEDFFSERAFLKNENKKELYDRFNYLLLEYKKFLDKKSKIKELRRKDQYPLTPKTYEED